jgi:sulfide:quinone oxidoreductase
MKRPMQSVIPAGVKHYVDSVVEFTPESNYITTRQGEKLYYDYLVVAAGLQTNLAGIEGLEDALADSTSGVSSIYSLPGAEQTWSNIKAFKGGKAIFTQPPGVVKCAGAPQKIMW